MRLGAFRSYAFGGAILLFGAVVALGIQNINVGFSYDAVGPRLFPILVACGLIASGAAIVIEAHCGNRSENDAEQVKIELLPLVLISFGALLQIFFIDLLGWIPIAGASFAATAFAFGNRHLATNLVIGFAVAGVILVIFNFGLGLNLPLGRAFSSLP